MVLSTEDLQFVEEQIKEHDDEEMRGIVKTLKQIIDKRREEVQLRKEEQLRRSARKYSRVAIEAARPVSDLSTADTTDDMDSSEEYVSFARRDSPEKSFSAPKRRKIRNVAVLVAHRSPNSVEKAASVTSPSLDAMKKLFSDLQSQDLVYEEEPESRKMPKQAPLRASTKATKAENKKSFAWPSSRRV